eukprot:TRINITY_DN16551_c0_g1_i2.p1 TRINITY_DN16551_c0_g1~~TRINITY_DN16551_c0_g1_i2.p1  ORF type:complete len:273 (-),score=104.79 TRINITY_DN16551_c0_g1_i2:144-920(-)
MAEETKKDENAKSDDVTDKIDGNAASKTEELGADSETDDTETEPEEATEDSKETTDKSNSGATAKATTKAKAKAPGTKAKRKKTVATHPPFANMITSAVKALKDRNGSSRQAILKYVVANYQVGDANKAQVRVKLALRKMVADKKLVAGGTAGKKGAGSFKLPAKTETDDKSSTKPAKSKKAAGKKKAKKPSAKKPAAAAKKAPAKKAAKGLKSKKAVKKLIVKKVGAAAANKKQPPPPTPAPPKKAVTKKAAATKKK